MRGEQTVGDILRIPVDREPTDRMRWLISLRWVALLVAAGVVLLADHWVGRVLPMLSLWGTLVAIAVYNLGLSIVVYRLIGPSSPFEVQSTLMHVQVVMDLVFLTVLLHFSGALENPFAIYYVLLVVVGSILMTRKAAYLYASIATLLWVTLLVTEAVGIIPHHNLVGFRLPGRYREVLHIVSEVFVLATANYAVAYLSSNVIERLREGQQQLYLANTSCELRAGELAELNRRLLESNNSCELRAGELVRLNERLREYDKTRSLFIRLVTHELRAPVAAIQSYLRLILDGYVPAERFTEIVGKAEQRACDQLELIGDLLDLARAEEPSGRAAPHAVDAAVSLHDVVDLMQARAQSKSLEVNVAVAPGVPPVLASEEHVKQVWTNLISNAIKYTPEGGKINVTLTSQDGKVRGVVQDTGIGMSPTEAQRVFENFYRTEAAKAMSRQGTGLGLSIVKGIMARYNGQVWVESEQGRGSTFFFEFPRAE